MGSIREIQAYRLIRPAAGRFRYPSNTTTDVRFLALLFLEQSSVLFPSLSSESDQAIETLVDSSGRQKVKLIFYCIRSQHVI